MVRRRWENFVKNPSVESLWKAFWQTPPNDDTWDKPKDRDGKEIPVNSLSFKYEVVRMAFELDEQKSSGKDCARCNGTGGERWTEPDGSEMGEVCPRCGGFGREP